MNKFIPIIIICFSFLSCAQTYSLKELPPGNSAATVANINAGQSTGMPDNNTVYAVDPQDISYTQGSSEAPADLNSTSVQEGDYVIGPEDLLEIQVYQVEELNQDARVSASGFIKLPLTGKIKAAGLTVSGLEAEIEKQLSQYLQEPLVSVFIRDYRSQNITILGAVNKPQVYTVTRQKSLLDMISIAGGLTKDAGDICYVRRGGETILIKIKDLIVGGDIRLNIPVFSGDFIHVPIGGIFFVDGAVQSPGSFSMQGSITATQAIAMARGFKFEAIKDEVKLFRDSGKPTRDVIDIDYEAILANKSPDVLLQDKDIMIVPESGARKFWRSFVESVSGTTRFGNLSVGAGF